MLFPARKKYLGLAALLFAGIMVILGGVVYADKSAIISESDAYTEPMDLTAPQMDEPIPEEAEQFDMFVDEGETSNNSPLVPPEAQTQEISPADGQARHLKSIKERWKEERKFRNADEQYDLDNYENDLVIRTQDGQDYYFSLELAIHPKEQQRGLMYRESMPKMHGMLFVFNAMAKRSFWMDNTLIPLDIIFIDQYGRIDHIHHMAKPLDRSLISSPNPSYAVLEINGGMANELGIEEGDTILHTVFKNRHTE
ncbi:MAG: DUF192 domain-containing protein [Alphaproteobacteria bacterium]